MFLFLLMMLKCYGTMIPAHAGIQIKGLLLGNSPGIVSNERLATADIELVPFCRDQPVTEKISSIVISVRKVR